MARPLFCLFCGFTAFRDLSKLFSNPAIYLQLFEKNQTSTVIADIEAAVGDFDIDTF